VSFDQKKGQTITGKTRRGHGTVGGEKKTLKIVRGGVVGNYQREKKDPGQNQETMVRVTSGKACSVPSQEFYDEESSWPKTRKGGSEA